MKFKKVKNSNQWDFDKNWKGKKKGYTIGINLPQSKLSISYNKYWFSIRKEDIDFSFNSLWKNMNYETLEECCEAAEKYLDEEILKSC